MLYLYAHKLVQGGATEQQIQGKLVEIQATFDLADVGLNPIAAPVTREDLEWSAPVAVGLDALAVISI